MNYNFFKKIFNRIFKFQFKTEIEQSELLLSREVKYQNYHYNIIFSQNELPPPKGGD